MGSDKCQARPVYLDQVGPGKYMAQIAPILDRYGPLTVNFCGPGEPTESEHFVAMATAALDGGHSLLIYSNSLRPERLMAVAHATDRVTVGASYHVGTLGALREPTYAALMALVTSGVNVKLMVPMAPPVLNDPTFEAEIKALAAAATGRFQGALIDLGHIYRKQRYPAAYTCAELDRLGELAAALGAWRALPRDIQLLKHMTPRLELQGMLCASPADELLVSLVGALGHCTPLGPLSCGTLQSYDVETLYEPGPIPCPYRSCHCKTTGITHCLELAGVTLEEHYADIYERRGELELAKKLRVRVSGP